MNREIVFPFGKFKGKAVASVPKPYLRWVLANLQIRSKPLQAAILSAVTGQPAPEPDIRDNGTDDRIASLMESMEGGV